MASSRAHKPSRRTPLLSIRWLEQLRMSLWLVPGVSVLMALLLARFLAYVDRAQLLGAEQVWYRFGGRAENARELLSTFASSIIALTGVVFSISVLVLQLASNQFSPRVLRTFLRDRKTQMSMGLFLGSFAYTISLMSEIRDADGEVAEFVPRLGIFLAYALVLASVLMFLEYIHHMAHSIRAVNIIKRIGQEGLRCLNELYPASAPYEPDQKLKVPDVPPDAVVQHAGPGGVLSAVDEGGLFRIACAQGVTLVLEHWVGDFIPGGAPLARVWGGQGDLNLERIQDCFSIVDERTPQQDPAFSFRQLVDIAERALSPGINDPTTCTQVLDQLHNLLRALSTRTIPAAECVDAHQRLRLVLPRPDWNSYVHLAFDEIRHYGRDSIQVTRRMRAILEDLLTVAPPDRKPVLEEQLTLLNRALERSFREQLEQAMARAPSAQGHGPN